MAEIPIRNNVRLPSPARPSHARSGDRVKFRIGAIYLTSVVVASLVATSAVLVIRPAVWGWTVALVGSLVTGLLTMLASPLRGLGVVERMARGLESYSAAEFTVKIDVSKAGVLLPLVSRFNELGEDLRIRQASNEQSDRLLHTLIDATPMAILLLEDAGAIEYANETARALFFDGRALEGANFLSMLAEAPSPFRDAVLAAEDSLFTVEVQGTSESYHLAKRHFDLHGKSHTLMMVKHLTRELRRQEIDVWKKLIRVLAHELNNSLAPISSLVHSARVITKDDQRPKLDRVLSTIGERARHLQDFVEQYTRFARLPNPRREHVNLSEFLRHIEMLAPYAHIAPCEASTAYFDRAQLEQVLINLLKNADEADGPKDAIALEMVGLKDGGLCIVVTDRGPGMSEEVLKNATLPFYSTKERGSGLGLALCREILEAHGGTLRIENRQEGGLRVTCSLPGTKPTEPSSTAKLTLSRV